VLTSETFGTGVSELGTNNRRVGRRLVRGTRGRRGATVLIWRILILWSSGRRVSVAETGFGSTPHAEPPPSSSSSR
jgi:hypothetical protein